MRIDIAHIANYTKCITVKSSDGAIFESRNQCDANSHTDWYAHNWSHHGTCFGFQLPGQLCCQQPVDLMFPEVTTAIPGAKTPAQAENNVQATLLPALDDATISRVQEIYDRLIRQQVHHRW